MAQEIADSKLIDTWSSSGLIVKPDISKIIEGWQLGEQPPHEYMNWLQNTFGSKLNHILKNGVASWNNTTQYLAGNSVQHSGNVWLCKVDNTNSEPTDSNANWKRIITVESLTTVLGGYVTLTGNQTITGIKTFSSSPIVPTPTTGDNSTKVATTAFAKTAIEAVSIGVGQTWQNVRSQRAFNVTYTNNTGKPIFVSISTVTDTTTAVINIYIDGILVSLAITDSPDGLVNKEVNASFIVPNGSTYSANNVFGGSSYGGIDIWAELR